MLIWHSHLGEQEGSKVVNICTGLQCKDWTSLQQLLPILYTTLDHILEDISRREGSRYKMFADITYMQCSIERRERDRRSKEQQSGEWEEKEERLPYVISHSLFSLFTSSLRFLSIQELLSLLSLFLLLTVWNWHSTRAWRRRPARQSSWWDSTATSAMVF